MKKAKIVFWTTTGLIFLFEGVMPALTSNSELARQGIQHLGYPDYFRTMLVFFKVLGALALVLPFVGRRIKEWAYAGFTFNFIAAAVSHWAVDGFSGNVVFPFVLLAILAASYASFHRLEKVEGNPSMMVAMLLPLLLAAPFAANAQENTARLSSGYAPVNGLQMYYEIHGEAGGMPLVLVHGSYMNIPLNWAHVLPELSKSRKVIVLELQGHGRTADTHRPFSYDNLANDVAVLIRHLGFEKADILGYSLGGSIAINTAIRHPEVVNKLVVVSAPAKTEGWMPQVNEVIATIQPEFFEKTPLKTTYDSLAPDPNHWGDFVRKLAKFETLPFDFGMENVRNIQSPVLLVVGDSDGMVLEHAVELFRSWGGGVFGDMAGLPKSQFAVIPAATHVGLMMKTDWLLGMVPAFLDGATMPASH